MANKGKDLVKANEQLDVVFDKHKDDDGFLYLLYTEENMFG